MNNHFHCSVKCINGLFSENECQTIKEHMSQFAPKAAEVVSRTDQKGQAKKKARKSDVIWVEPHPDINWAAHRIEHVLRETNEQLYGFDIQHIEQLQYLKYKPWDFFKPHFDVGAPKIANRKLTLSVQLSHPRDYWGGALAVTGIEGVNIASKNIGDAIIFPTYLLHQAHTIYSGSRECLVAWMCGEQPFK